MGTFVCFFQFCTGTFTAAAPAGLRAIVEMGRDECKIDGHSFLFQRGASSFLHTLASCFSNFSLSSILT